MVNYKLSMTKVPKRYRCNWGNKFDPYSSEEDAICFFSDEKKSLWAAQNELSD
jgi:hypothetical protein